MHDSTRVLPHQRLRAFQVAKELLLAVIAAKITDAEIRDQVTRAAKGACLNVAEAAGRGASRDRARVFMIACGEASEAAAAVEIAEAIGATSAASVVTVFRIANELIALLTGLGRAR
jgi:four helix bundle protein